MDRLHFSTSISVLERRTKASSSSSTVSDTPKLGILQKRNLSTDTAYHVVQQLRQAQPLATEKEMARKRSRGNFNDDDTTASSVGYLSRTYKRQSLDCSSRRITRQQARAADAEAARTLTESSLQEIDAPASSSVHAPKGVVPFSLQERSGDNGEAEAEELVGQSASADGKGKDPESNNPLSSCSGSLPHCQAVIDNFLSTMNMLLVNGTPPVAEPVAFNGTPVTLIACENMECNQETTVASNCEYIPEKTCSNLTEVVRMLGDFDSDDEEIDSNVPDYIAVQNYKIRKEYAPTVSAILKKHGDIAEKCSLGVKIRSILLEQIAIVIEKLKDTKFVKIKESEVTELLNDVDAIKRVNVNIEWLQSRLLKVKEVKNCLSLKQLKDKNKRTIKEGKEEIQQLRRRIDLIEERVTAAEATNKGIIERSKSSAADAKLLIEYSLIHDLL